LKGEWNLAILPHAGGLSANFFDLKPFLPAGVHWMGFDYPGRGSRPVAGGNSVQGLAVQLLEPLRPLCAQPARRTVFLGYSLGGLVGYEAACLLAEEGRAPDLLLTAAAVPPQLQYQRTLAEKYYPLEDGPFLKKLGEQTGVDVAPFQDPLFRRAFLPTLRREVEMAEEYRFVEKARRLTCPIISLYGKEDRVLFGQEEPLEGLRGPLGRWGELTDGGFSAHFLEGGHFFLLENPAPGMEILREGLEGVEKEGGPG
jgi:medium-chain acyl-[acyl-carrier-protein] hydrolase